MKAARCVCGCGDRPAHLHHVVYRQDVRRAGGDESDPRNLVAVAFECHSAHHSAARRYRLDMLPDSVFEFAAELLGAPRAFNYLDRRYAGLDLRLDALLAVAT